MAKIMAHKNTRKMQKMAKIAMAHKFEEDVVWVKDSSFANGQSLRRYVSFKEITIQQRMLWEEDEHVCI